jgi:aspartate aminotransferase
MSYNSANARLQQISNQMASPFEASVVPKAPEDPLFGLMAAYRADTFENKVDLGIGAYRDNNGKPWVLPVVKLVSWNSQLPYLIHC